MTRRLTMLVPTRGRPQAIKRQMQAFSDTMAGDVRLVYITDADDPGYDIPINDWCWHLTQPPRRLGATLNFWAPHFARSGHVGFMGDDHLPRTQGWDLTFADELDRLGTGVVYGNDLLQGQNLPTAVAQTGNIIETLGFFQPPGLIHLFFDNYWKVLGESLGALSYLPDVVIEHMHPVGGKAQQDATYVAANASEVWHHDEGLFLDYMRTQLISDVAKLKAA